MSVMCDMAHTQLKNYIILVSFTKICSVLVTKLIKYVIKIHLTILVCIYMYKG